MIHSRFVFFLCFSVISTSFFGFTPVFGAFPNDPYARQSAYEIADVYGAWEYTNGSSEVVVAIVDNGFDGEHPDLRDMRWVNTREIAGNGRDDDTNGYVDDVYGWNFVDNTNNLTPSTSILSRGDGDNAVVHHATMVAGIIGAMGNNGRDGAGIAHGVRLMNLKAIGDDGKGTLEPLIQAIYYAVDNGAHVVNVSMVGYGSLPAVRAAIQYAYQRGVVIVAAAGNNLYDLNEIPQFPICSDAHDPYTSVIGVSAVDESRRLALFSNIGSNCIDVTAPGVNISGPLRYAPHYGLTATYGSGWSGTSFATPFVSAAAALIKSVRPIWGPDQIVRTIQSTVRHTPSDDEVGYREVYGKGLLQVGAAVTSAVSGQMPDAIAYVGDEVDRAFTAPRRLITTGRADGNYYDLIGESAIDRFAIGMQDVKSMTTFRDKYGTPHYVVVRSKDIREDYVMVYGADWIRKFRWSIPRDDNYQVLASDLTGDGRIEIILMRMSPGTDRMSVYRMDGTALGEFFGEVRHQGAVATVWYNHEMKRFELIYAYRTSTGTVVVERLVNPAIPREYMFETSALSLGSIAYVHDAKRNMKYIAIGSESGTTPLVTTFDSTGTVLHSFRPFALSFRGGVQVFAMLYGDEGREYIATVPKQGNYPLFIYDYLGRKIGERSLDDVLRVGSRVVATVAPF